ncbi:MAG: hypothetical protein ACJ8GN_23035 [Longimicrobiaceae bacterium]
MMIHPLVRGVRIALVQAAMALLPLAPMHAQTSSQAAMALLPLAPMHAQTSSPAPDSIYRHHLIFLIDQSGSVLGNQTGDVGAGAVRDFLRTGLAPLLADSARNGFGALYDPERDLTSALSFGLFGNAPYFASGLFRPIWIEERRQSSSSLAKSLADSVPKTWTKYTGVTAAPRLVLPAVRAALGSGRAPTLFERTFLVMVTDDQPNISPEVSTEMGTVSKDPANQGIIAEIRRDQDEATAVIDDFEPHYKLERRGRAASIRVGNGLKVMIREVVPQWGSENTLLAARLAPEAEVIRNRDGIYSTSLSIFPSTNPMYQLARAEYRAPGAAGFSRLELQSTRRIAIPVSLRKEQIGVDSAQFRLWFVRRDTLYGQALWPLPLTVHFRTPPPPFISLPDWLIPPAMNERQALVMWTALAAVLLLAALWLLLFPSPRVRVELVGVRGAAPDDPLVVNFAREGTASDAAGDLIVATLRFVNVARRGPFPRVAERPFDVRAEVDLELPAGVEATPPVVGLGERFERSRLFQKVSHNSEQTVVLRAAALRDYAGDPRAPAACTLTVQAFQLRAGWRRAARPVDVPPQPLFIRFVPEPATVEAELQATGRLSRPAVGQALLGAGKMGWVEVEHRRGAPGQPPLMVALRSNAERVCSEAVDARVQATIYRADRGAGPIPGGVELDERTAEVHSSATLSRGLAPDGRPVVLVRGIRPHADGGWDVLLPLFPNFYLLPLPPVTGDEYVLEVALLDDKFWPEVTLRHGIRVLPDSRRPGLRFEVSTRPGGDDPAWRTFDPETEGEGAELKLDLDEPLRWNAGTRESTVDFLALRVDNVAHSGGGRVSLALLPEVSVEPGRGAELPLEPGYAHGRAADMLALRSGGHAHPLGALKAPLTWEVASDAPPQERPLQLWLSFDERAVTSFDPRMRRFPYVCRLPFECIVERDGGSSETITFSLAFTFAVERYAGEHVLAVDFGTSAVVAAFAGVMDEAVERQGRWPALLDLQSQYAVLLREREANGEGLNYTLEEQHYPNREAGTPFIPSQLVWRSGKKLGGPDFVELPATSERVLREVGRAIFYLKGLILEGRYELPEIQGYIEQGRGWTDADGHPVATRTPPVEGVIRSAYRGLMRDYVERLLKEQAQYLDRVVFTHPNNFHLRHLERMRDILRASFGERFHLHLLSESNAVALYCSYPPQRFDPGALSGTRRRKFLVYDIGAGTLDVTYTVLDWAGASEAYRLREMEVLFKSGVPSGGNRLDLALARILDAKLRVLETVLRERGVPFEYVGKIVDPDADKLKTGDYAQAMLPVKLALMKLKEEAGERAARGGPFTLRVPVDAGSSYRIVDVGEPHAPAVREQLERNGIPLRDGKLGPEALIPLTSEEIFAHPEVVEWVRSVTDEPIADLAHALKLQGVKPEIDCLILSGRTSQFLPVREHLLAAIERELGITRAHLTGAEAVLGPLERKAAVGLGALYYGLIHRHVRFVDRSVWAYYGVVYETTRGKRFQEFFSHATRPDPARGDRLVEGKEDGLTSLRLSRTNEITRSGGQVWVVVTYSRCPDRDLENPDALQNGRFTVVKTLGRDVLGEGLQVRITLGIDDDDRLTIVVEAGGRRIVVDPKEVPMNVPEQPQWAWPFIALKHPVALAPAGKVPVPALGPLPAPDAPADGDTARTPDAPGVPAT